MFEPKTYRSLFAHSTNLVTATVDNNKVVHTCTCTAINNPNSNQVNDVCD